MQGTGSAGRITKEDVLAFIASVVLRLSAAAPTRLRSAAPSLAPPAPVIVPGELVPLSRMRSIIAQRMVESKHTSPHVHTCFKIDLTKIVKLREKEKQSTSNGMA